MTTISLIMPTVDWGPTFALCLQAARAALAPDDELLVVFDGMPPPPPEWLQASGAVLLHTGARSGPAAARNLGAGQARNSILLFVDADVELHADVVGRIRTHFSADPHLAALFGSYDDSPAAPGLVSRFRNLLHHHTHTSHRGPACTFWAGCGAVRRESFLALGGFDAEAYRQPCIEDIEFGLRLHDAGGRILLDPAIQGTHHKRWTLSLMLRTDIQQRAIPWSQLLLRRRQLPATLNLSLQERLSAALCVLIPLVPILAGFQIGSSLLSLAALGILIALNRCFLRLLLQKGGIKLALTGACLHYVYYLYSSLTCLGVLASSLVNTSLQPQSWLRGKPRLRSALAWASLIILAAAALTPIGRGFATLWTKSPQDLTERYHEWILFRNGIYPHSLLANPIQKGLAHFRTSVYLPWAFPMLTPLFAWGGMLQAKATITILNLASLILISSVGWKLFIPWGTFFAWFGALSPLAIRGMNQGISTGQFSIICAGLLTIQWLLMSRQLTRPAGLCWALAMIKPHLAIFFGIPMLTHRHFPGFQISIFILATFTTISLWHTNINLLAWVDSWLFTMVQFVGDGNPNVLAYLIDLKYNMRSIFSGTFMIALPALLAIAIWRPRSQWRLHPKALASKVQSAINSSWQNHPIALAALCSIAGPILFYKRYYDNILLYPALFYCWQTFLRKPTILTGIVASLISISLCAPLPLLTAVPHHEILQLATWILAAMSITIQISQAKSQALSNAPSSKVQ